MNELALINRMDNVSQIDVNPRTLLSALRTLVAERDRLQECMDELRKVDDEEIIKLINENRELRTTNDNLKLGIINLNKSDASLRQELASLKDKRIELLASASGSEAELRKEVAEVKSTRDHLLQTDVATQAELVALRTERDTLRTKLSELKKWVGEQKTKAAAKKGTNVQAAAKKAIVQVQPSVQVQVKPNQANTQVVKVGLGVAPSVHQAPFYSYHTIPNIDQRDQRYPQPPTTSGPPLISIVPSSQSGSRRILNGLETRSKTLITVKARGGLDESLSSIIERETRSPPSQTRQGGQGGQGGQLRSPPSETKSRGRARDEDVRDIDLDRRTRRR